MSPLTVWQCEACARTIEANAVEVWHRCPGRGLKRTQFVKEETESTEGKQP